MSIEGDLSDASLAGLLQMLCGERRKARLMVWGDSGSGTLILEGGRIRHASMGDLAGDPAAIELLTWTEGVFRIDAAPAESPQTVQSTLTSLLWKASHPDDPVARRGSRSTAMTGRSSSSASRELSEDALIALLSTLDRQVARLAELAERRQGAQALAVLEELANETLDFVAKNLPERRDSWRPDFLLPALKGSHPALELFELRNQRLSLDLPRNLVREYAREPDRAARYLLHVGRGVLTLARAWFEELAQSFSTELRRSEWRSAFAAIEQDFENALATERATEKVI